MRRGLSFEGKSLIMRALESQKVEESNWNYLAKNVSYKTDVVDAKASIKTVSLLSHCLNFQVLAPVVAKQPISSLLLNFMATA